MLKMLLTSFIRLPVPLIEVLVQVEGEETSMRNKEDNNNNNNNNNEQGGNQRRKKNRKNCIQCGCGGGSFV
jgi:hypothetical protein